MKTLLAVFSFCLPACAEFATFAWDPSPSPGLSGYRLYWGTSPANYDHVQLVPANVTQATANGLLPGRSYYFAATSLSTNGLESEFSNQVFYRVPFGAPSPMFDARTFQVSWLQDGFFRDTLEMSSDLKDWTAIPGPYPIQKGVYHVAVPMDRERLFFRVKREKIGKKNLTKPPTDATVQP